VAFRFAVTPRNARDDMTGPAAVLNPHELSTCATRGGLHNYGQDSASFPPADQPGAGPEKYLEVA